VNVSSALALKFVSRHTNSRFWTTYSPGGSFAVHFVIR
jgi:hypothetical protein